MANNSEHKSPENHLLTFGVYARLLEDIKHYDTVQATYRAMTSSLLLASFAAIGYLFSIDPSALPLKAPVWVVFIGGISLAIITTMAVLDLVFQERLMIANIIEALKLEAKNTWLPKIQHRMLNLKTHPGSPNKKAWFYIGCADCLILIIGLSIVYNYNFSLNWLNISILLTTIVCMCLYGFSLRRMSKSFEELIADHFDYSQIKKMQF